MAGRLPGRARKRIAKRPVDVDERDFLDMILTEVNEEEAAEILEEPASELWSDPPTELEKDEKE